jgi:hypothetical protein
MGCYTICSCPTDFSSRSMFCPEDGSSNPSSISINFNRLHGCTYERIVKYVADEH